MALTSSMRKHASMVGVFFILLFGLCLLWQAWSTDPAVQEFHLTSLKFLFPGFTGYDLSSVIAGAAWSFAYGFVGSHVVHGLHGNCCLPKK